MARKRLARRCKARRTNGEPCAAFAVTGCEVCSAHGGSAPQVRATGLRRYREARIAAAFDAAWERQGHEQTEWQVRRFVTASRVLGIPPDAITRGDLFFLVMEGKIPPESDAPKLRHDRRYGPRTPAQLATRAARQAERKAAHDQAAPEAST
ncbi:MAG TPA: hypothetical protein VFB06_29540 [Streptosporangiaceae bacterium]|nr:hypothetical protein [Streptosporangiaceae bacterium]